MMLICIDERTIHNMDNGNTYIRHSDSVEIVSSAQHDDSSYMMPNLVCAGESATAFWTYLMNWTQVKLATADPQPAPVETPEPRKFKVGDHVVVTRKVIEDDWFWLGRSGRVLNTDGDNGYQVDFDGQSAAMLEEQLTIYDDTVPF